MLRPASFRVSVMTSINLISNRNTKFLNLSSRGQRWKISVIVKAADKGGALVVWQADRCQKEALQQLSDTSFYAKS